MPPVRWMLMLLHPLINVPYRWFVVDVKYSEHINAVLFVIMRGYCYCYSTNASTVNVSIRRVRTRISIYRAVVRVLQQYIGTENTLRVLSVVLYKYKYVHACAYHADDARSCIGRGESSCYCPFACGKQLVITVHSFIIPVFDMHYLTYSPSKQPPN